MLCFVCACVHFVCSMRVFNTHALNIYKQMSSLPDTEPWGGIPLPKAMIENLCARGVISPTPVQAAALAQLCTGQHAMVAAPTGTGKTLAFLLPVLVRMQATKSKGPLRAIVVLPTRELALQVCMSSRLRASGVYL
jgi:superfamily II DNA/RNA helicase